MSVAHAKRAGYTCAVEVGLRFFFLRVVVNRCAGSIDQGFTLGVRVYKQAEIKPAIEQAEKWMTEFQVPVVIEVMLERVTNISMGTEIDAINEFEELAITAADAPTAIGLLD